MARKHKLILPGTGQGRPRRSKRPGSAIPAPSVAAGKGPFEVTMLPPDFNSGRSGYRRDSSLPAKEQPILDVPLGSGKEAVAIRVHEYAHLGYGREVPEAREVERAALAGGLSNAFFQAGADVIANTFASSRGMAGEIGNLPLDSLTEGMEPETQALWMMRKMSTQGGKLPSPSTKHFTLDPEARERVKKTYSSLAKYGVRYPLSASVKDHPEHQRGYVKTAYQELKSLQDYFHARKEAESLTEAQSESDMLSASTLGKFLDGAMAGHGVGDAAKRKFLTDPTYRPEGSNRWGAMTIKTAKLDRTSKRKGAERVAGFMGAFRSPMRLLLPAFDGRAWAIKRRQLGGTILIDYSGSMRISPEELQQILMQAPLAKIAAYSGGSCGSAYGTLWVLAKDGRYAGSLPASEGGNVIDGPALSWLARQEGPRVWISDGVVTGVGDAPAANLVADAYRRARVAGAIMFPSIGAYLDAVKGARKAAA